MTRGVRIAVSIVAWVPILFGIVYLSLAIIDGYMVTVGRVPPGEPMFVDEWRTSGAAHACPPHGTHLNSIWGLVAPAVQRALV